MTEKQAVTDPPTLPSPVQFRDTQQHLCREVLVHYPKHDGRRRGEKEVKKNHQPVVDHGSSREATEELVPEQKVDVRLEEEANLGENILAVMWTAAGLRTHHVLVEKINDHVSQAAVAPVSVDQEEFLQVLEVRNGEITCHDCLQTMRSFRRDPAAKETSDTFRRKDVLSDLHAFLTRDPDTNISRLDHVDIIGTVT